ncbi:14-3-3-like protein [Dentipellis sp. KUC8613]|nr:14-3-3-like protein [Dentipellis sp. KUC8613]
MSPVNTQVSRAECLFIAKLADESERWDDVITQLKSIISFSNAQLTVEERNLLSVAYKNATGTHRASWRTLDTLEKHQAQAHAPRREAALLRRAKERIERDIADACRDVLALLERTLVPAAAAGEEKVFYKKMQGDYYRYLVECARRQQREHYAQLSLEAYKGAYKHALGTLEPWHPTRLGLALNFAVYYRDVRGSPERACHLAKHAFDEAVAAMWQMPEQACCAMICCCGRAR